MMFLKVSFILRMVRNTPRGIVLVLFALSLANCAIQKGDVLPGNDEMTARPIKEVLKEHTDSLMALPGVVGTAQGLCDGNPCIMVLVVEKTPELEKKIPERLEGYPVRIEETGEIRALPKRW